MTWVLTAMIGLAALACLRSQHRLRGAPARSRSGERPRPRRDEQPARPAPAERFALASVRLATVGFLGHLAAPAADDFWLVLLGGAFALLIVAFVVIARDPHRRPS